MNRDLSATSTASRNQLSGLQIDERDRFDPAAIDAASASRTPLIMRGAVLDWPAVGTWTPQWLAEQYGSLPLLTPNVVLSDVVERIDNDSLDAEFYARNLNLAQLRPSDLASLGVDAPQFTRNNWLKKRALRLVGGDRFAGELFVGPVNMKFPFLHWDSCHINANICMVHGTKEVVLFPPDQGEFLYPAPGRTSLNHRSDINDVYEPDLERFPLFQRAVGATVRISAGDRLFIPGGWWHTVRTVEPSISVVVPSANEANWADVASDFPQRFASRSPKRLLSKAMLSGYGRYMMMTVSRRAA